MKLFFVIISILGFNLNLISQNKDLASELSRLNTSTALVINSQAIDEYPVWSKNSDYIGCNIMGKWYKIRLTNIELDEAEWKKRKIGVVITKDALSILDESELNQYKEATTYNNKKIITSDNITIEFNREGMNSVLKVTKKDMSSITVFSSGGENCHSLSISPNQKYVAYLCELTGLIIFKIDDLF